MHLPIGNQYMYTYIYALNILNAQHTHTNMLKIWVTRALILFVKCFSNFFDQIEWITNNNNNWSSKLCLNKFSKAKSILDSNGKVELCSHFTLMCMHFSKEYVHILLKIQWIKDNIISHLLMRDMWNATISHGLEKKTMMATQNLSVESLILLKF